MRYLQSIIKIHVLFAGFFLPAAVTFAITGGLYTLGYKGGYETKTVTKILKLGTDPGLGNIQQAVENMIEFEFNTTLMPSGQPGIRKVGTSWSYDWPGVRSEFSLEPTGNPDEYKYSYKKTDPHRFFVQLHKAKGGWPFKVLAVGLALAFLLLFASGVALAVLNPRLQRLMGVSVALGIATFIVCAALS